MTTTVEKRNGTADIETAVKWLRSALATKPNGAYELTLTKASRHRTIPQNRLMWMWFNCIEEETGTPAMDVHDHYCKMFTLEPITINGRQEMVVRGTKNMDTAKFTEFLEKVRADVATESGIRLPSPDEQGFEEFARIYGK